MSKATPASLVMNAWTDPALPIDTLATDFIRDGARLFPQGVDAPQATALLSQIRSERHFDGSLFLSESEFDADPQYVGVNPRPGRNLLERFQDRLGFVESAPPLCTTISRLLGPDYQILNKKIVCGVPASAMPDWLMHRIAGNPVNNLGAYVRPEFRDVTYFFGIDFHQDLIDYKEREADFLTLYVYLHPVTRRDAPLFLLPGSHRLGGAVFPHDLKQDGAERWIYRNGDYGQIETAQLVLTGDTGFAALWHACTLHGTQPDEADHERISLRYLIGRRAGTPALIDAVNASLQGPLSLSATRIDLGADGSAAIRANTVNRA